MRRHGSWLETLATFGVLLSLGACGGSSVAGGSEASGGREGGEDSEDGHTGAAPPASTGTPGEPTPTNPTPVAMPVPSAAPPEAEPNPISSAAPAPTGTGTSAPHGSAGAPGVPTTEVPSDVEPSELVEVFNVAVAGERGYFDPFDYVGPAIFGFTPDGARVVLSGHSSVAEFDAETGVELVGTQQDPVALARDAAFALELRHDQGEFVLHDLASDTPRWAVPAPPGLELATFSTDERYAIVLWCDGSIAHVQRFGVDDGATESAVTVGWCDEPQYEQRLVRSLSALPRDGALVGGVTTLYGREQNQVFEVMFSQGAAFPYQVFDDAGDHVVELLVAPGDAGVALVGSDDQLRFYDDATFARARFNVAAPLPAFHYYVPPLVAPLGISPDARYIASTHEDRRSIALRRASDGVVLASALHPQNHPYSPTVPILATFDATGDRLAVLWLNWLAVYDVR
jgi:hypothetical protein